MNLLLAMRTAAAGVAVLSVVFAQDPNVLSSPSAAFGVSTTDAVRAMGPGYSARFDDRGIEYLPVLGRGAARPYPIRFTLEAVRRGAHEVAFDPGAAPAVHADSVRYERSGTLSEVYDARRDGVEQSFVFASKPAGTGDLVVRGAIATELPLASASDDGVHYELPGAGGVTFGAVTGVDANGATARGSIRVASDGAHVEWVLPAAFVDGAAYPLVLDPLIGSAFAVGDAPGVDLRPAVAFDEATGRYLVAWTVVVSASVSELRGQLVAGSGVPIGPLFTISAFAHPDRAPVVVACNAMNRFLVMWRTPLTQVSFVNCAIVNPSGVAQVSALANVTGGSSTPYWFGVGGDLRIAGDKCLLAYGDFDAGTHKLMGRIAQIPASGAPILGTPFPITSGSFGSVAVSDTAGAAGRWLVAWSTESTVPGQFQDIECATVSEAGTLCSGVVKVFDGGPADDVGGVDCATADGSQFVVSWQDDVTGKVRVRPVQQAGLCPSSLTLGTTVDPIGAAGAQTGGSIDFAKGKYVLVWTQSVAGTGLRTYVKGLDPVTCGTCGAEHALESSVAPQDQAAVGTRWSGGDPASDEALVVWSNGTIRGRRFEASGDDNVVGMGGGCSLSGLSDFATYNGNATIGATDFQLVVGNPVSLPLILVLGFGNLSAPCGSCTIVPTLDILLPATNPFTLSMPCDPLLVGQSLYTQWVLLKPSDCPILPDLAFTNALRFTIGE